MTQHELGDLMGITKQAVNAALGSPNYTARLVRFALHFQKEDFLEIEKKMEEKLKKEAVKLDNDDLITAEQAASMLGVKVATLTVKRSRGMGPAFLRLSVGSRHVIRYKRSVIEELVNAAKTK